MSDFWALVFSGRTYSGQRGYSVAETNLRNQRDKPPVCSQKSAIYAKAR